MQRGEQTCHRSTTRDQRSGDIEQRCQGTNSQPSAFGRWDDIPVRATLIFALDTGLRHRTLNLAGLSNICGGDVALTAMLMRAVMREGNESGDVPVSVAHLIERVGSRGLSEIVTRARLVDRSDPEWQTTKVLSRHSSLTAQLSARLARLCKVCDPDWAWMAGMLHDIGKLPIGLRTAATDWREEPYDHAVEGAHLAHEWGFPETVVSTIRNHHAEEQSKMPLLVQIVAAADAFANGFGIEADMKRSTAREERIFSAVSLSGAPADDLRQVMIQEFAAWKQLHE